jgi:hypothetical protein
MSAPDVYNRIESDPIIVGDFERVRADGRSEPRIERRLLRITNLGHQFVAICVR